MSTPVPHIDPVPAGLLTGGERTCAGCTLCCVLPEIAALDKPADSRCRHCDETPGCRIYDDRPQLCRDFFCLWRVSDDIPEHWRPAHSGMLVYRQGPQLTVLCEPSTPDRWKAEPYRADLQRMAAAVEADGGYLVVFAGDAVTRVRPVGNATIPPRS